MKKEVKDKIKKKVNTSERKTAPKPADNDLGAYGLEPPRLYRKDQRLIDFDAPAKKRQENQKKKNAPKTIQQQRLEQNKKRKQKLLIRKICLYAALVFGIAAVIIILSLTVLFKIQTITINGNEKYSKQQISAVLPIEKEKNLFLADASSAEEKLEENLPYIYDAQIKRKLPSTIVVNIKETPQVYAIKDKNKMYVLLDDNFKVLELNVEKMPAKAILIKKAALSNAQTGKEAEFTNKKIKENLKLLIEQKNSLKLKKITEIYSADINNNYMVYDGRITIKLGSTDNLENKIYSALAAIEKLEEQNPQAQGELTVGTGKQVYFTEK